MDSRGQFLVAGAGKFQFGGQLVGFAIVGEQFRVRGFRVGTQDCLGKGVWYYSSVGKVVCLFDGNTGAGAEEFVLAQVLFVRGISNEPSPAVHQWPSSRCHWGRAGLWED